MCLDHIHIDRHIDKALCGRTVNLAIRENRSQEVTGINGFGDITSVVLSKIGAVKQKTMVVMNRNLFKAAAVVIALTIPAPAFAQSQGTDPDPRKMLEGAAEMMLQALELMLNAIPQYEPPEVLENGDIIIRRKPQKQEQPSPEKDPDVGQEKT